MYLVNQNLHLNHTTLTGKAPPWQSRYELPVCKDTILQPPSPKPPHMPIDRITSAYQQSKIKDKPMDIKAIEPDLNTDFKENATQQEGIICELYENS